MTVLILQPTKETDLQLFKDLAKRLNVQFREEVETSQTRTLAEREADFMALAGSWNTPESGDEIIKMIEKSRINKEIDTTWAE